MSSSEADTRARSRALLIRAVIVGSILGALVAWLAWGWGHRASFDTLQQAAPREITADNVVVVEIDDEAAALVDEWPWPRYAVATLIEKIAAMQPTTIGIDIYFLEPDRNSPLSFSRRYEEDELDAETRAAIEQLPDMDAYLGAVLFEAPTVLARIATDEPDGRLPDTLGFTNPIAGPPPPDMLTTERALASIEELDSWAFSHGLVNGKPDIDGVVRRVPLAAAIGENVAPGFAAELARMGTGTEQLQWDGSRLLYNERQVHAGESADMLFKMGEVPPQARISAAAIIRDEVDPALLADKVVVLGVSATGTFDIVATPLDGELFGMLVQAQAVDAIIEGEWLERPAWVALIELFAALCLIALALAACVTTRPWPILVAGALAVSLPIASILSYVYANTLFYPVTPLIFGAFAAGAFWLMRYLLTRAERTRLAAELVEERVRASEQKGELAAARRIQMSMVPGEKVLGRLDARTEIGAVLEPAKSVGGDFFDAVKVSDDLLLFMVGDVTGKGVPAALFMALSKTLSKSNLARAADGLEEAVGSLNRDLMDEADEEMGLTMLVGLLDCSTGHVQLVNAGHENPLVLRGNGEIENLAMRGGPPFCVIDFPYQAEPYDLADGETLVVITDGATEAANEEDELFGLEGVIEALMSDAQVSATERAAHLAAEVRRFEGDSDPSDDLTIFALRYLGNAG